MSRYERRNFDVTINGTGFLLARSGQTRGGRAWQRMKPPKAVFRTPRQNVQPGAEDGEFIINFDNTPALGWGEIRTVRAGAYAYARNVDARFPGQVTLAPLLTAVDLSSARTATTAPSADPVGFWELPTLNTTTVYYAWGQYVVGITSATPGTFAQKLDLGSANAIGQVAVFDGKAHITQYVISTDVAGVLRRQTADAVFGTGDATDLIDAVAPAQSANGPVLYGIKRNSSLTNIITLASGKDATVFANWADNAIAFGDTGEICRWLVAYGYQVFGAQPNGFYGFDAALNSPNVLSELRTYRKSTNGLQAWQWHAALWIPHIRGLFGYDGQVGDAGPVQGTTMVQDASGRYFGYPTAGVGDSDWQYVATWNGTDSYVFAGREGSDGEPPMVWHPWLYLAGVGPITCMHITAQTDPPRLFLGSKTEATAIEWAALSRADNSLQDPQPFAASGDYYTSFEDCGLPGVNGTFEEVTVEGDSLTASETLTIAYRTSLADGFTTITGAVTATGTTKLPDSTATRADTTLKVVGTGVQFKVSLARGATTTNTPILRALRAKFRKALPRERIIVATVQVADDLSDRLGNPVSDSGATLLSALTTLEGGTSPITVKDPLDNSITCTLVGDVQVSEAAQPDDSSPVLLATCKFREYQGS